MAGHPPPILCAAIICDCGVKDPGTGKYTLVGLFDVIAAGAFPASQQCSLYLKLTEVHGESPLMVEVVHDAEGKQVGRVNGRIKSPTPLAVLDTLLPLELVLPWPGRYQIRVFAGNAFIGHTSLEVVEPQP